MNALATSIGRGAGLMLCGVLLGASAQAQLNREIPGPLQGVGVTQKLDQQVPLQALFQDEDGRSVQLGDYFAAGRPVLLTLGYYRCPMLCDLVLNGMIEALQEIDWVPGREFSIVTISFDPGETPQLARLKRQSYLESYRRPEAAAGWHFLTGPPESIRAVAEAVGFEYRYLEDKREFAHPASLFVLTPAGRVSRYLFGVKPDPRTLRLSLVEASEGRIGTIVDQFLLYCYRYDSAAGQYTPLAWKIMRIGGLLTAILLGSMLLAYRLREMRVKRTA